MRRQGETPVLAGAVKRNIDRLTDRVYARIASKLQTRLNASANVDIILAAALREQQARAPLHNPVQYVGFLRECWQEDTLDVTVVKRSRQNDKRDNSTERELRSFRPLDYRTACALAAFADERGGDLRHFDGKFYQGTIADHFLYSSSLGRKARILYNILRRARPEQCLEIGTAWGMSTLIIAEAQRNLGLEPRVITIEPNEPQHSVAAEMLAQRYGDRTRCVKGKSDEALSSLQAALDGTGFVFDDGAHWGDMYLANFERYRDHLLAGATILVDDIRWDEGSNRWKTDSVSKRSCHQGWMEIIRDDRVTFAMEIGTSMGLAVVD
jgi:predicted O-methyltransferase YrrM